MDALRGKNRKWARVWQRFTILIHKNGFSGAFWVDNFVRLRRTAGQILLFLSLSNQNRKSLPNSSDFTENPRCACSGEAAGALSVLLRQRKGGFWSMLARAQHRRSSCSQRRGTASLHARKSTALKPLRSQRRGVFKRRAPSCCAASSAAFACSRRYSPMSSLRWLNPALRSIQQPNNQITSSQIAILPVS